MPTEGFKRLFIKWSTWNSEPLEKETLRPGSSSTKKAKEKSAPTVSGNMFPILKAMKNGLQTAGFFILQFLCLLVFNLYYLCNGTFFKIRMSKKPENYKWSAQVCNILLKHKYDPLVNLNSVSDFILLHENFVHPSKVLCDEVTLYEVNDTEAVFIEAPPGVEVWRSKYGAFCNDAQLENACKAIIMPIESFYKLANKVGDPQGRLVFITNTARCGSTLLSRIYEETDNFVTYAEPSAINCLYKLAGKEDKKWVQDHCRAVVRLLCKPTHVNNYAVKVAPTSTPIVPMLQKVFPNASQVFIYRDGLPSAKSMFKIWMELPMGTLNLMLARHFHRLYVWLLNWASYYALLDNEKEKLILGYGYGQACYYWGSVINSYRKFKKEGYNIAAIKYEDLVKDKENAVSRIFKYCAVPQSFVGPALRAFNTDSQANSKLSINNLKQYTLPEFDAEYKKETDRICEYFDVTKLGESCVLEGTLTREDIKCPIKS